MSAYICEPKTFDRIVTYVFTNKEYFGWLIREYGDAQNLGQTLVNENYRSVNARYNETDTPFEYAYTYTPEPLMQVLSSVDCLNYQSCETDDWNQTKAYEILDHIKDSILRKLIKQTGKQKEYDSADWG